MPPSRTIMRKTLYWMGHFRAKDIFRMFLSLTWLSALIYLMIWQLIDTHNSYYKHHRRLKSEQGLLPDDPRISIILSKLGLDEKQSSARIRSRNHTKLSSEIVFAIALDASKLESFYDFLGSFRSYFSGHMLIVYNLGIPEEEVDILKVSCQCELKDTHLDLYPLHLPNLGLGAYVPFLIQDSLQQHHAVFWCDTSMRFTSSDLQPHIDQAIKNDGLVSWSNQQFPTSALSHYNTFRYLRANHNDYYFQRMVLPTMGIYVNSGSLQTNLMLPWVRCALDVDCISPRGSQPGGCSFTHKPKFIYAGCHHYEVSAFNIILGLAFNKETPYLGHSGLFVTADFQQY